MMGHTQINSASKREYAAATRHNAAISHTVLLAHRLDKVASKPTPYNKALVQALGRMIEQFSTRFNTLDSDPGYPLDIVEASLGLISHKHGEEEGIEVGEGRLNAAVRFAAYHWRIYGYPVAAQDNGYRAPLNEEQIDEITQRARSMETQSYTTPEGYQWIVEESYRRMRDCLVRRGKATEQIVIACAVHCREPKSSDYGMLRKGLDALMQAKMPSSDDIPAHISLAA